MHKNNKLLIISAKIIKSFKNKINNIFRVHLTALRASVLWCTHRKFQILSVFHHNLQHFGYAAYFVVNMQVIDTVEQAGDIKLYCAAFGFGKAQHIALPVEKANGIREA